MLEFVFVSLVLVRYKEVLDIPHNLICVVYYIHSTLERFNLLYITFLRTTTLLLGVNVPQEYICL